MPLPDLCKLTAGLSRSWAGYLRDWDRSLRSGNYPETTRYNYLLAAAQLRRYLGEYSPDPDAEAWFPPQPLQLRRHGARPLPAAGLGLPGFTCAASRCSLQIVRRQCSIRTLRHRRRRLGSSPRPGLRAAQVECSLR
jgi:hypothetical protein